MARVRVNGIDIYGEIENEYQTMIDLGRPLGNPTTSELDATGGRWQEFGSSSIYWKNGIGAHQIGGSIRTKWRQTGWENGTLGFPITPRDLPVQEQRSSQQLPGRVNLLESSNRCPDESYRSVRGL